MKENSSLCVLMLVYVDDDWMDIGGNVYPQSGYVECKYFTDDINIENGLYGILWGETDRFLYEKKNKGHWLVVKTEWNKEIIKVNSYNRYKFRNGFIVKTGKYKKLMNYLVKNKML
jgi:hypothetical protein